MKTHGCLWNLCKSYEYNIQHQAHTVQTIFTPQFNSKERLQITHDSRETKLSTLGCDVLHYLQMLFIDFLFYSFDTIL